MNRRKALWMSLLAGGLLPTRLLAQDRGRGLDDDRGGFRRAGSAGGSSRRTRLTGDEEQLPASDDFDSPPASPTADDANDGLVPEGLPEEPGQVWRTYPIERYTRLVNDDDSPQNALLEWIFRRTGSAIWHGERVAVLSAGRAELRAYHNRKVLQQVEEMVERFTDSQYDYLRLHARFISAPDPRWRYIVYSRMDLIGTGPQGQQIWTMPVEDSAMIRAQLQLHKGRVLADQERRLVNGQTLSIRTTQAINYAYGLQRDSAVGLGFQQGSSKLDEGVVLRVSPLLNYAGDKIELALDLRATTVKALHRTKVMTRREIGPVDMTIDVPEVVETRLNQIIKDWPLGRTLVISAGIQPGILDDNKRGFLNLGIPGTYPTSTELLVFLDAEAIGAAPERTSRREE